MDLRLKHPFSMCVSGPSQAGKSQWVLRLLQNLPRMVTVLPKRVLYCYGEWQPMFEQLPSNVTLHEGLPDVKELKEFQEPQLVVLDDMMDECSRSPLLNALFTKYVHHYSMSVIFLVQNIFYSKTKTARINTNYMVLFKSPADKLQIAALARQLYPTKSKDFLTAYEDAISEPYSYLLVDLTQATPNELRLRSKVFPDEYTVVYVLK